MHVSAWHVPCLKFSRAEATIDILDSNIPICPAYNAFYLLHSVVRKPFPFLFFSRHGLADQLFHPASIFAVIFEKDAWCQQKS